MINQIGKITLYVENQKDAIDFWTKKANFVVKLEQPMGPTMKWVEVGPSEDAFTTFVLYEKKMMQLQNPATNLGHPSILLSPKDVHKTYEQFKEAGITVGEMMSMPYGTMFTFQDQDGNSYMVRED